MNTSDLRRIRCLNCNQTFSILYETWCKTFNFKNLTIIINIKGDSYYVEKI
ncbi:hypothetical protein [Spiroplasma endosymbiont of Zeiraphera isertana]|uniref:hypothetical protein n=1 Tax=Spiroplasma endosymbiont of Zeiraphera isertana TaxID=3066313 RepID=UPI00313F180A